MTGVARPHHMQPPPSPWFAPDILGLEGKTSVNRRAVTLPRTWYGLGGVQDGLRILKELRGDLLCVAA